VIEDWRLRKWRVARVPRFAAHLFAYRFVLVPAANKTRNSWAVRTRALIKRSRQAHRNWARRLRDLFLRNLWSPASDFLTRDLQLVSVARCLDCRPTIFEYYWPKNKPVIQPCGRFAVCPFCYARRAEDLFRRVIRSVMSVQKTTSKAIITCRIETYVIAAPNFADTGWDDATVFKNVPLVRAALISELGKYKKIKRELARKTYGSAWSVVVNPIDAAWEIQIRQLFITTPKARKPVSRAKKSSAIFLQSAKISDINEVVNIAGSFVQYPRGLLSGYVELAATALHARENLRLYNATGCLYRRNTAKKSKEETRILPDVP
jgi:hypothetical protein